MYTNTRSIKAEYRLCFKTMTPKVGLQNLRAYKTWILSNSWATSWRMCCGPHGARIHTHFWDVTVLVLLLTSFWRSFLFLHRVLLSTVQGQVAPQTITTNQNFLFWSLHSLESNCYQNKSYGDSKAEDLQRLPYSKRALLKESVIYVASVFKTCKAACGYRFQKDVTRGFIKRTVFPVTKLWFTHVRSVVNNISESALHKSVCIIATLLGIKLLTNSNKFISIVTLRHNICNW